MTWGRCSHYWSFMRGFHRSPVDSSHQGPATSSFDVFFGVHVHRNKWLNEQWSCRCLRRHDVLVTQHVKNHTSAPSLFVKKVILTTVSAWSDDHTLYVPRSLLMPLPVFLCHYIDVIMTTMASQITSLTVVSSIVYSDADQRKHQSSASLAFVWRIPRDRWIPRTKGQLRGKCFHLMTSSCQGFSEIATHLSRWQEWPMGLFNLEMII